MTNLTKLAIIVIAFYSTPTHALRIQTDKGRIIDTKKVAHIEKEFMPPLEKEFKKEMEDTKSIEGPRIIVIDSPGGSIGVGKSMIKMIEEEQKQGTEIICLVKYKAHSMGFFFLSYCDTRLSVPRGIMLVHKIRIFGAPPNFTAKKMREMAEELDKDDNMFKDRCMKQMNLTSEEYDNYADKETTWSASTLKKRGFLHDFAKIIK